MILFYIFGMYIFIECRLVNWGVWWDFEIIIVVIEDFEDLFVGSVWLIFKLGLIFGIRIGWDIWILVR